MGSIISAISDDIDEYEALCRKYGEKIQYSYGSADCYGEHADSLKYRSRVEYAMEQGKTREEAEKANAYLLPKKPKTAWDRISEEDE